VRHRHIVLYPVTVYCRHERLRSHFTTRNFFCKSGVEACKGIAGGCTRKAAGVATESRCRAATAVRSQGQDFTLLDSEWGSIFTLCSRCRTRRTRSHCTVDGQGCSEPNAASAGTDRRHVQMLLVSLKPHRVVLAMNKPSLDCLSRSSASD